MSSLDPHALRTGNARAGPLAVLCATALACTSPVAGQSAATSGDRAPTSSERLTLAHVLDEVTRASPRIAAAEAQARAAAARVAATTRPPDPQAQFGVMNYSLPQLGPMPVLGMLQLQIMQMVPIDGKLRFAGQAASALAEAATARSSEVRWELRSQASMAFYDLYAAHQQLAIARETLQLLQDIARTAESMYRVGEGRQTDVLRARVEVARMVEDTLRMQAMRQSMDARLNALLDRESDRALGIPVLSTFPAAMPARRWLDSLAERQRPMVRAGQEELRAAEASERLVRRELFPDLQVGVQYGQRGSAMTDAVTGEPMGRGTDRMGSVMIGASIPIFARSRQLRMREEAGAMTRMARAELLAMRADTRGRIGETYALLDRARRLAALYHTTVLPQAEATVASALSAYRVGSVDFMTLLDNRMTVNRYRQELATLESEEGKAWADLEMLTATVLIDRSLSTGAMPDARHRRVAPTKEPR
jgi:outer membrane protein, heavy metal efflux system